MTEIKGIKIAFNFGTLRHIKEIAGKDPLSLNIQEDLVGASYAIAQAAAITGGTKMSKKDAQDWVDSFDMNDFKVLFEAFNKFTNPEGTVQLSPQ